RDPRTRRLPGPRTAREPGPGPGYLRGAGGSAMTEITPIGEVSRRSRGCCGSVLGSNPWGGRVTDRSRGRLVPGTSPHLVEQDESGLAVGNADRESDSGRETRPRRLVAAGHRA